MDFRKISWVLPVWAMAICLAWTGSAAADPSGATVLSTNQAPATSTLKIRVPADSPDASLPPMSTEASETPVSGPLAAKASSPTLSTAAPAAPTSLVVEAKPVQADAKSLEAAAPSLSMATPEKPSESALGKVPAAEGVPLEPIPEKAPNAKVEVHAASFNGVTPGTTTLAQVKELWGKAKQEAHRNASLLRLYSIDPFDRVEVSFSKNRVLAIVIRLDRPFPASAVAEQLELSDIQPVLVSNELGEILGESFPERGVMFAFEPADTLGEASMEVNQIILEAVDAEAFVLRAETYLTERPEASLHDLAEAIKLNPRHARAHWLRARGLSGREDLRAATSACEQAVRVDPGNAQYRLTHAEILGQLGRFSAAEEQARKALLGSAKRPHVKARALCLLGDLASSTPKPDYRRAIDYHMEAIKTADPLATDRHPAIRMAAKRVLIDAHLGAAHDIAWGPWDHKENAVPRWLGRADALANDLAENDGGSGEDQFRVAVRALAAHVGMRGKVDPAPWTEKTLDVAQKLADSTTDPLCKQQLHWDLGMALYDVVQIHQMRSNHQLALKYGKQAIGYLEPNAGLKKASVSELYLLGRLYFRLGAIYAVGSNDHAGAIPWFSKALPVFEKSLTQLARTEYGRLGETHVSMGVSFWQVGQREKAVQLTQRGVNLMEQAVSIGALDRSAMEIPLSNLATMSREMGRNQQAAEYLQQAKRHKNTTTR